MNLSRRDVISNPDGDPARQRRPKRDEVRDRLIDGAALAFAEKGFAGASIDLICKKAGFSRGAFYSNFDDKDALFFALYDRRTDRLWARMSEIAQTAQNASDPLAKLTELLARPDADELRWDILNKEFIIHALRNPEARAQLLASRTESRARLAQILTGLRPDLIDDPAKLDRLCRFIIALHEGELTQIGLDSSLADTPSLLSEFIPVVLAASKQ